MPPRPRKRAAPDKSTARRTGGGALKFLELDPIITMDAGGIIQSASDSVERVFGWTPLELMGKNVRVLIPEPRRSALDRYLDRYRNAGQTTALQRTRRFDAVRKDGTTLQIELSMSRADLPVLAAPFFIGIVRDINEQIDIRSDEAAERSRLQLLITEQTRALASANLRLQLADRLVALGTLAAGLGHDMNNVLLPIRAHLNALEHAGIAPTAASHLVAVRGSIAYLQHLSDGLHFLALDPDGQGVGINQRDSTPLAEWWAEVGTLLKKAVPKHVKVQESLPSTLPPVRIARHWLTQAVLNLIVNAGEAMPRSVRSARIRISAKPSADGRTVKLSVADNGRGMSHAVQRRAFDLFFTTKPRTMGTGLGLPLARKVAVRSGGDLEIQSAAGRGTTVIMTLPVAAARAKPEKHVQRYAAVSVRNRGILARVSQILMGAGLLVSPPKRGVPGDAELWITEPTTGALAAALTWRRRFPRGVVMVLGAPARRTRAKWSAIGATVIDLPDDFVAIRHALIQATEHLNAQPDKEAEHGPVEIRIKRQRDRSVGSARAKD